MHLQKNKQNKPRVIQKTPIYGSISSKNKLILYQFSIIARESTVYPYSFIVFFIYLQWP